MDYTVGQAVKVVFNDGEVLDRAEIVRVRDITNQPLAKRGAAKPHGNTLLTFRIGDAYKSGYPGVTCMVTPA